MMKRRRAVALSGMWALAATLPGGLLRAQAIGGLQPVTLAVPGPGNLLYMPATLAVRLGEDRAQGLALALRYTSGGPQAYRELVARNADFAVAGMSALALQRISGKPVVSILAINQVPAYTLLVRRELQARVGKIADLKGRVVGVKGHAPGGRSTTQLITEHVLARAGLKADSVNFVPVGQSYESQHAALASASVDAIMGDEPFASRMVKRKIAYVLVDFHDAETTRRVFGGLFLNAQLCTREDVLATQAVLAEKVVRTIRNTLAWIHKKSAGEIVEALVLVDVEARLALQDVLTKYKHMYSPDGSFPATQVLTVERFLHATEPAAAAQGFKLDSMIDARWAGRKP